MNTGTLDSPVKEWRGILQVDVFLTVGIGTGLFRRYADRVEQCWVAARATVPGVRFYTTHHARELADAPEPWIAKHVDTDCLWIAG